MDPTTVCCPHWHGPARGHIGQGTRGIHAPKAPRCLGHACHQTFSARTGTVFSRRRPSAATVVLVVTWLAPGWPVPAVVAALGVDERTVADGWARSGRQGQAVPASLVERPRDLGHVPADALRVQHQGGMVSMALALLVTPRWGRGGAGSEPRALSLRRRRRERGHRWAAHRPRWVGPDGWCPESRAMREPCRRPVRTGQGGRPRRRPWRHVRSAHVVKRDARRRVVDTARRRVDGPPARVETLRRRSQGAGGSTTADMERLQATCRERLAPLARRGRARARHTLPLPQGLAWIGTVENFCTPHARLSDAGVPTPALAAGMTEQCWTVQALRSFHVPRSRWAPPKRRGRPARALQRLIDRWCA